MRIGLVRQRIIRFALRVEALDLNWACLPRPQPSQHNGAARCLAGCNALSLPCTVVLRDPGLIVLYFLLGLSLMPDKAVNAFIGWMENINIYRREDRLIYRFFYYMNPFSTNQPFCYISLPPRSTRLFSQKSMIATVLSGVGAIAAGAGPVAAAPGPKAGSRRLCRRRLRRRPQPSPGIK